MSCNAGAVEEDEAGACIRLYIEKDWNILERLNNYKKSFQLRAHGIMVG